MPLIPRHSSERRIRVLSVKADTRRDARPHVSLRRRPDERRPVRGRLEPQPPIDLLARLSDPGNDHDLPEAGEAFSCVEGHRREQRGCAAPASRRLEGVDPLVARDGALVVPVEAGGGHDLPVELADPPVAEARLGAGPVVAGQAMLEVLLSGASAAPTASAASQSASLRQILAVKPSGPRRGWSAPSTMITSISTSMPCRSATAASSSGKWSSGRSQEMIRRWGSGSPMTLDQRAIQASSSAADGSASSST